MGRMVGSRSRKCHQLKAAGGLTVGCEEAQLAHTILQIIPKDHNLLHSTSVYLWPCFALILRHQTNQEIKLWKVCKPRRKCSRLPWLHASLQKEELGL